MQTLISGDSNNYISSGEKCNILILQETSISSTSTPTPAPPAAAGGASNVVTVKFTNKSSYDIDVYYNTAIESFRYWIFSFIWRKYNYFSLNPVSYYFEVITSRNVTTYTATFTNSVNNVDTVLSSFIVNNLSVTDYAKITFDLNTTYNIIINLTVQ
jgi:hypothetical protein